MPVEEKKFGKLPDGREAKLFILKNKNGMVLEATNYGCRLVRLFTKDRSGILGDVILGHRTLEEYFGSNFQGTFVGRYANRIGGATFSIDGESFQLTKNEGNNTLHGGPGGYHQVLWNVKRVSDGDEPSIAFTYQSPDGEEGYPGNLDITVTYTLTSQDELVMEYSASSDKKTPFNPTNHSFFNLTANPQKEVLDTYLTIASTETTLVNRELIPTGELADISGTPIDFSKSKKLGDDMFANDEMLQFNKGFDLNYCVAGEGCRRMAEAYEPESGRVMTVYSDLPGVQLYTFNAVSGLVGKDGKDMKPHTAFCLETQFFPDSVNHENFPFTYVEPGKPFCSKTVYHFTVK